MNDKICDIVAYSVHCDLFLQGLLSRGVSLIDEDGEEISEDKLAEIASDAFTLSNLECGVMN